MPQPLSDRTAGFTDSIIRRMTRISLKYGAVNLSQGFPDFDPPQVIRDRLCEVAQQGPHQYAVTWGAQNFREALAEKQSRCMGRKIDPDTEVTAVCGSTEAMMCAMMTVVNPGDRVVVFSPFYENYGADAILSGAEPVYIPLHPPAKAPTAARENSMVRVKIRDNALIAILFMYTSSLFFMRGN